MTKDRRIKVNFIKKHEFPQKMRKFRQMNTKKVRISSTKIAE